jgi:hypothetical protein
MAEEATDVIPETTEVVEDAVETTTETESSEVEQTTEETQAEETESVEASEDSEEESDSTETVAEEESEADETKELKPKSQNRFQQLANERNYWKQKAEELEQLKVPTEEDYLEAGDDELTASVKAIKAERERDKAVDSIVNLNQSITNDMQAVQHEFPELDPNSKVFNEKLAKSLMDQYDRDTGAEYDPDSGLMISTTQLPYQYIKDKMDLIGMTKAEATVEAQKNVERMVAQSDTPSSTAPQPQNTNGESLEQMRERLAGLKF